MRIGNHDLWAGTCGEGTVPLRRDRALGNSGKILLQSLVERRVYKRPEAIVVPHESLKSHLMRVHDKREHRLQVITNSAVGGAQDRASCRAQLLDRLGVPADSNIAGTAAPLIARTRLKDLIWATDLLTCIREDIHFVIFGTGEQEARLRRFVSLTEADGHVHFLGNDAGVLSLINGIDFYWHSHLREPLPSGLLFSMAGGIPVVSVYGPQIADVVVPQTTGLAVNFGARDEFARWTKYLIELPDAAAQLARQGREHVLRRFPADRMTNAYLEIYEQTPVSAT